MARSLRLFLLFIFVVPFFVAAQQPYKIKGTVDQLKDGSKIFLIYEIEGKSVVDSTVSQGGNFLFSGRLAYSVSASLYLHKNPYVEKPAPEERMDYIRFYLEPVAMEMRAKDSLYNSVISGSPINADQDSFKKMRAAVDDKFSALNKEFYALPADQQADSTIRERFMSNEKSLVDELYGVHLAFVRAHPSSYLSLISLSFVAGQEKFVQEAAAVYKGLSPELLKYPLAKEIPLQLESSTKTQVGQIAPDLELQTPAGKTLRISDFRGQYLLLDFWASWCGPCREENPNLVAQYAKYKDLGFEILGISLDGATQKDKWVKAIADDGLSWPQVSDLKGWDSHAAKRYGINSIPASFLLDPNGKIIARDLRGEGLNEKLQAIFAAKVKAAD